MNYKWVGCLSLGLFLLVYSMPSQAQQTSVYNESCIRFSNADPVVIVILGTAESNFSTWKINDSRTYLWNYWASVPVSPNQYAQPSETIYADANGDGHTDARLYFTKASIILAGFQEEPEYGRLHVREAGGALYVLYPRMTYCMQAVPSPSPNPTDTPTNSPTPIWTPTPTYTATSTATPTPAVPSSPTSTRTPTPTATRTATAIPPTATPTSASSAGDSNLLHSGLSAFSLYNRPPALGTLSLTSINEVEELEVNVTGIDSANVYYPYLIYAHVPMTMNQRYELRVRFRAETTRSITFFMQSTITWTKINPAQTFTIGAQWQEFVLPFTATQTDPQARLLIVNLGFKTGRFWMSHASLVNLDAWPTETPLPTVTSTPTPTLTYTPQPTQTPTVTPTHTASPTGTAIVTLLSHHVSPNLQARGSFGVSVAIEGNTAVVGTRQENAAYVYINENGIWNHRATLSSPSYPYGGFGFGMSVALSGDVIVVGSPFEENYDGAAYVYRKPVSGWNGTILYSARLLASDRADEYPDPEFGLFPFEDPHNQNDSFGISVAIDGDVIVVGADNNYYHGAAYVYVKPPSGWSGTLLENSKLTDSTYPDPDISFFGCAVAISGDTVVIGRYGFPDEEQKMPGRGSVFVKPPNGWNGQLLENAVLIASNLSGDIFLGHSVALEGDTIVLSAQEDDGNGSASGVAYVFNKPDSGWSGTIYDSAKLKGLEGMDRNLAVSLSGETIVAGVEGDYDSVSGFSDGSFYVFTKPAFGWHGLLYENTKVTTPDPDTNSFGCSVDMSGNTIIVGAEYSGSAYIYDIDFTP